MMKRLVWRAGILGLSAGAGILLLVLPASAHVTLQPASAAAGSYSTLSFKVPTEEDDASTVGLDVQFPADTPIASVSVQPKSGWTYKVARAAPPTPLTTDDGEVKEVVTQITWTAQPGNGIRPGEFDTFTVSAGPLPAKAQKIVFKTLQTYSNGKIVRWVEVASPGGPEPTNPAPALTLTTADHGSGTGATQQAQSTADVSAADNGGGSHGSDGTARGLGIAGVALGALGLIAGGFALAFARRRA